MTQKLIWSFFFEGSKFKFNSYSFCMKLLEFTMIKKDWNLLMQKWALAVVMCFMSQIFSLIFNTAIMQAKKINIHSSHHLWRWNFLHQKSNDIRWKKFWNNLRGIIFVNNFTQVYLDEIQQCTKVSFNSQEISFNIHLKFTQIFSSIVNKRRTCLL